MQLWSKRVLKERVTLPFPNVGKPVVHQIWRQTHFTISHHAQNAAQRKNGETLITYQVDRLRE